MVPLPLLALLLAQSVPAAANCSEPYAEGEYWIRDGDYPAEALRKGEQGATGYRLDVDARGCVTGCTIVHPSGIPALDEATCPLLMRRARFRPAIDVNGAPIASTYSNVNWWLLPTPIPPGWTRATPRGRPADWVTNDDYPSKALRAEEQGLVAFRLDVDALGFVTGCTVLISSGSEVLDETTCRLLPRRARFNPALDAEGKPVPGNWQSGITWAIPRF